MLMADKKILETFLNYYKNPDNINKILPHLQFRETAFLTTVKKAKYRIMRNIRIASKNDFDYRILHIMKENCMPYMLYYSLCSFYGGFPIMPRFNNKKEQKEIYKKLKLTIWEKIWHVDWLIDFDSPSYTKLDEVRKHCLKTYFHLEKKGFKPDIRFSGRGFHLLIDYQQIRGISNMGGLTSKPFVPFNKYNWIKKETKLLHDKISKYIDYDIADHRRITKVPHSLIYNPLKSKKIFVCKPLTLQELKEFDIKNMELQA